MTLSRRVTETTSGAAAFPGGGRGAAGFESSFRGNFSIDVCYKCSRDVSLSMKAEVKRVQVCCWS